jgi:hypothetical protein
VFDAVSVDDFDPADRESAALQRKQGGRKAA